MYHRWHARLINAPRIKAKSWGHLWLRYAVTQIVVVRLTSSEDYPILYGFRVRRDGVSFGNEVPVRGNLREVESL